jgi:hypothetical protein
MPIIHFTAEQVREAMLPPFTGAGEVTIGEDGADDCEGVACGERPQLVLPSDEYARWLDCHAEQPPVRPHSHMVVRGRMPLTRRVMFAVFKP